MQLAAPAHRQWLLLFFCTSKLIGTNPSLLALIQGEILSLEEDGGGVLWLCSCQQVIFQAKPARMATDVSGQRTQQTPSQLQFNSWDNG